MDGYRSTFVREIHRLEVTNHCDCNSPGVAWVRFVFWGIGAGDRIRTGDIDLGKVALYQLSYSRLGQRQDPLSRPWRHAVKSILVWTRIAAMRLKRS